MTDFSSRGPNLLSGDIIKPDITAPGIQILAGNSPFPDPGTAPTGELFQAIAGTSMSSPHVAGVYALLKQANPDWSAAAAKSALMTTVVPVGPEQRPGHAGDAVPAGCRARQLRAGRSKKARRSSRALSYDAVPLDYFGFLCDAEPSRLRDRERATASRRPGIATKAYDLNLPSIGVGSMPGSVTVKRTVTSVAKENGNRTYTASVVRAGWIRRQRLAVELHARGAVSRGRTR